MPSPDPSRKRKGERYPIGNPIRSVTSDWFQGPPFHTIVPHNRQLTMHGTVDAGTSPA